MADVLEPRGTRLQHEAQKPSRTWLRRSLYAFVAVIALVGLGDSIFLTVRHLTGQGVDCMATEGCETVLTSRYAQIGKVPLAAFGAVSYFIVFSLALLAAFDHRWPRTFFSALVAVMFAMTCWLFYLQAFVLHAFCEYCLLSATLVALMSASAVVLYLINKRAR